ncbi:GntR family transcriptional regulator [Mumia zhuanghuii]|uniref:GntR family transcriptional regulator n=1 Tax=Mumia zhuanghuii TaxID=2585211 RepID=A0A5C4MDW7_9ACTN|nr:GntR family transcriptional regulator [Mumia zhuanghuii]TNC33029.1 GntR family transcriptional regulator [Mumia zhuanghuii]TNC40353.1 GntR family transcriptional regulator [Mumia zhuanghuii]
MFDGPEPIYIQIADQIRAQILSGDLPEEAQVMSTTQYATTFRINPATAAKAFGLLVDEGLIEKRRGLGMFVAAGAHERLLKEHREAYLEQVFRPAVEQADLLGIPRSTLVTYLTDHLPATSLSATEGEAR